VNPGFLMDFLPLALTGVCRRVSKVTVERIQDARFRRIPFQKKIGAGLTRVEFARKADEGTLRHVGLTESVQMIAAALGWKLDSTEDVLEPIVAEHRVETPAMTIESGDCLGVSQTGRGLRNGKEVVTLVFKAAIGLENPRDRVLIDGEPGIDATIAGGVNGDIATCAMVANAIPVVVKARPGLRTMADIEPISCRA
jgi:2,4-diaminopentanoate dehydrogenase